MTRELLGSVPLLDATGKLKSSQVRNVDLIGQRLLAIMEHDSANCALACVTDSVGAEAPGSGEEWVRKLARKLGARYPAYTVNFLSWDQNNNIYRAATVIQVGTGSHTLTVYGAGLAGYYTQQSEKYMADMLRAPLLSDGTRGAAPDLILEANGHNASQGAPAFKRGTILSWSETATRACPEAELALIAQNGETNDTPRVLITATGGTFDVTVNGQTATINVTDSRAARKAKIEALSTVGAGNFDSYSNGAYAYDIWVFRGKAKFPTLVVNGASATGGAVTLQTVYATGMFDFPPVKRSIAQQRGFGFVDVFAAFAEVESFPGQLTLTPGQAEGGTPDGTHPNNAGYELWADTVLAQLTYDPQAIPRAQQPSSLEIPVDSLLLNGDFRDWDVNGPLNWTAVNTTSYKDFVNYESAKGFAMRSAPTAPGSVAYREQSISGDALKAIKGRTIVLTARMMFNNADSNSGNLQLRATSTSLGSVTALTGAPPTDEGRNAFRTVTVSMRVPDDTTAFSVRIYSDFGSDGGGDITWEWVGLTYGNLPRMPRLSAPDPLGAALFDINPDVLALADAASVASITEAARGNVLSQATAGKQPTVKNALYNGHNAIRFDGVPSANGDVLAGAIGNPNGTGSVLNASNQVTGATGTWTNGDVISGAGIPLGTTVTAGGGTATLTMSANATADGAGIALRKGILARPMTIFTVVKFLAAYSATQYYVSNGALGGMLRRSANGYQIGSTSLGTEVATTPEALHIIIANYDSPGGSLAIDNGPKTTDANIGGSVPAYAVLGANVNGASGGNFDLVRQIAVAGRMSSYDEATVKATLKAAYGTP